VTTRIKDGKVANPGKFPMESGSTKTGYGKGTHGISNAGIHSGVAVGEARARTLMRSGDRRLMMPNQILPQPIVDALPGPGVRPAITHPRLFRRELFAGVWKPRLARPYGALRRALSPRSIAVRPPRTARNRRQADHEDTRR